MNSTSRSAFARSFALPSFLFAAALLLAPRLSTEASAQAGRDQFPLPTQTMLQEQKVLPTDQTPSDGFGRALALKGTTALIGANGANGYKGAAYIFTETSGIWTQTQELTGADTITGDGFGNAVALAADTLLVGASGAGINGASGQGAAYVFQKQGDSWAQTQKLVASDGAAGDRFGTAVGLSGRTLVVTASYSSPNGQLYQGSAYVFTLTNGTWKQTQKLTAGDGAAFDHFGDAVALQNSTLLVGAPVKANFTGKVYVFARANGTWTQTQSVTGSDSDFGNEFGTALALDRGLALVGAPDAAVNGFSAIGAVYSFAVASGILTETQKISAHDGRANDGFGASVALSGTKAIVGAPEDTVGQNSQQGKAYLFRQAGGNWKETGALLASDGRMGAFFGWAVALDRDTDLVGSIPYPHNAAYFFMPPASGRP